MSFHPSMGANAQRKLQARNRVSCILPGLVWPGSVGTSLQNLVLPGLAALLGRARVENLPAEPYAAWLSRQFGAESLPWGALRWVGDDLRGEANAYTLCADPVSLAFARDTLILKGPRELALQPDEISALISTLNTEFADVGHFHAASPERWYLLPAQAAGVRFQPLADVLGRPVALFQPEGDDAPRWARLANEIQIVLHNHPVNRAREARGQPLVNALWFWGEAALQALLRARRHPDWRRPDAARPGQNLPDTLVQWSRRRQRRGRPQLVAGYGLAASRTGRRLHGLAGRPAAPRRRTASAALASLAQRPARRTPAGRPLRQNPAPGQLGKPHRLAFWRKPLPAAKLGAVLGTPFSETQS
ncbi:MAG: hypothetical protein IPL70_08430 [Uliginosibacterium sp.]|nr:hypothetical protein [Uliginosibacterium sp.]